MNESMRAKLSSLGRRLEEIDAMLSSPEVGSDMNKFRDLSRERAEIEPVVQKVREYEKYEKQRAESEELLSDPDMKELARGVHGVPQRSLSSSIRISRSCCCRLIRTTSGTLPGNPWPARRR